MSLEDHIRIDPRTKQPFLDWPKRYSADALIARFPKLGALVEDPRTGDLGVVTARRPYWESRPGSGCIGHIEIAWINDGGPKNRYRSSSGSVELYRRALGRSSKASSTAPMC